MFHGIETLFEFVILSLYEKKNLRKNAYLYMNNGITLLYT